ncbi:DUF1612 domain-containing protein [Rhizobium brockwellii]|uniref:DUF1612 domain-containing protein n=1 Tax=Rhizobium brockwellii TaxID=3019932 RepID=UPI003F96A640
MLRQAENLPAVLEATVALDVWNELSVLQHAPWLGGCWSSPSCARPASHLAAINLGPKAVPVDRRCLHDAERRLMNKSDENDARGLTELVRIG